MKRKFAAAGTGLAAGMMAAAMTMNVFGAQITEDKAKSIALDHAGEKEENLFSVKLEADIVIGWVKGNVPKGGKREKYLDRLAKNLRILAAYGAERNVKLNLEVINRYEVNIFTTARETVDFLETYQLDNCYVHLDTFHMGIDECDPVEAIRISKGRLGYFHLADNSRRYPGSGQFEFSRILGALLEIGYGGYLSVECLPWPSGEEAAAAALRYLKPLAGALGK